MATYILLLTLTSEGKAAVLHDAGSLLGVEEAITGTGVNVLGLYAVLGDIDFVSLVEAPDNQTIARFSLELGVRAGAHIATLPAIPIARLDDPEPLSREAAEALPTALASAGD
jgi:uncharacterized protein with GYD domain